MLRIGVIGCADFAWRQMLPAIVGCGAMRLVAVASRSSEKARRFADRFGCEASGYDDLLARRDLDAVYLPLPTGLHEEWIGRAIDAGLHVLAEKSFAVSDRSARALVAAADERGLLLAENFAFLHHAQHARIREWLANGEIGALRWLRSTFTFPSLPADDFRWDAALGGGALLDAGTYCIKAAQAFLGGGVEVRGATLRHDRERGVDAAGEAMLVSPEGLSAQLAWGFDAHYQCRVELLGSAGRLVADRAFTAKPDFEPTVRLERADGVDTMVLPADDQFSAMCRAFASRVAAGPPFDDEHGPLVRQAELLTRVREAAR